MRYFNKVVWGPIGPKWAGTYEVSLHPLVRSLFSLQYSRVINVGCAEGYYAVGFARAFPNARVEAYDVSPQSRASIKELAELNDVRNLAIRGRCDDGALLPDPAGRTLIMCDIEGDEYDLLDPSRAPGLRECDVLVECHADSIVEYGQSTDAMAARFALTHQIERYLAVEMTPTELKLAIPEMQALAEDELLHC